MALSEPAIPDEGTPVVLSQDFGQDTGMLTAGTNGKVVTVHDPGTPGVGDDGTPTVQIELVDDPHGRNVYFPVALFGELWEKAAAKTARKVTRRAR